MGRQRLRKSERKKIGKNVNQAIYIQKGPKPKFIGRKSEADLKRIGIKKGKLTTK